MSFFNKLPSRVDKDFAILILIITVFYFINLELTIYGGAICFALFLHHRMIRALNPDHGSARKFFSDGKEVLIPEGVELFELTDLSADSLFRYVNIFSNMMIHPRILIVRFQSSFKATPANMHFLVEALKILYQLEVRVIFSDVNDDIKLQLIKIGLIGTEENRSISANVNDALTEAGGIIIT